MRTSTAEKRRSEQGLFISWVNTCCSNHHYPDHSTPVRPTCSPPPDSFQMLLVVDATDENGEVFSILEAKASHEAGNVLEAKASREAANVLEAKASREAGNVLDQSLT